MQIIGANVTIRIYSFICFKCKYKALSPPRTTRITLFVSGSSCPRTYFPLSRAMGTHWTVSMSPLDMPPPPHRLPSADGWPRRDWGTVPWCRSSLPSCRAILCSTSGRPTQEWHSTTGRGRAPWSFLLEDAIPSSRRHRGAGWNGKHGLDLRGVGDPLAQLWTPLPGTHFETRRLPRVVGNWIPCSGPSEESQTLFHLQNTNSKIKFLNTPRSSFCGSGVTNLTRVHEDTGSISSLAQWVKDPVLLWLWCGPAAAALIWPLAWEPPYAAGEALKRKNKKTIQESNSRVFKCVQGPSEPVLVQGHRSQAHEASPGAW